MKSISLSILIFGLLSFSKANIYNFVCQFGITARGYTCTIPTANFADATGVLFETSNHLQGRSNADVVGFSLTSSGIPFFPLETFELFPSLEQIILPRANVQFLEANVFGGRSRLLFLDLRSSNIQNLDARAFVNLTALIELNLSDNSLQTLPVGVFDSLTSLEYLNIRFNVIRRIEANIFVNNRELTYLNLEINVITYIDPNVFDNTRKLQSLYLGTNTCVSQNFVNIPDGDLTNILPQLQECFGRSPVTCEFTENTQILGISEFGYTCTISETNLTSNQRRRVAFGGSHVASRSNSAVINLRVQYSNISFFMTEMFTTFTNLKAIEITSGGLEEIRANDFINAENLESIYMQYNNIKVLSGGIFAHLPRLQKLSLSRNEIERVDGNAFAGLSSLRLLYLNNNRITRLNRNTLNSLVELRDLNLASNYLTRISSLLFSRNPEIGSILLNSNHISAIERDFLNNLPRLAVLNLLSNVCVNALFDGNRVRINEGLRDCYEEHENLPAEGSRRVIMEVDGEVGLIKDDGTRVEL